MHAPQSFKLMKKHDLSVIPLQFSVEMEVAAFYQCSAQEVVSEFCPFFFNIAHVFLKLYNC